MNERGFSLLEAILGTMIAVIAVLGLAYSFGLGRGYIDRYQIERSADFLAQRRMEWLGSLALRTDPAFAIGAHSDPSGTFYYKGTAIGAESWRVEPAPATVPQHGVIKQVTVTVNWTEGGFPDSVVYLRAFSQ